MGSKRANLFGRGYHQQHREELFKIAEKDVNDKTISLYFIDFNQNPIKGAFYSQELVSTILQDMNSVDKL